MSDYLSIKVDFKTRIMKKCRSHYPLATAVSEEEFGCDIFAEPLLNMASNDPLKIAAFENAELLSQAITELTDVGLITSQKTAMTLWSVQLTEVGYIQSENVT
ncbi:hypothetical protein MUU49_07300 [Scandinavium goeteborgense]|uniref:hypothetical protein n=1 Tax=Scandinavium goeteborgense TaxID=1851514 RepID=UPI00216589DC|nr:hypothetical protein [Scandinavium goeteborgense]MCS2152389.1 hypothetical protein [Scandinavium goeteborgense]